MNPNNEEWAAVCSFAQSSWVDAVDTMSSARPSSSAAPHGSRPSLLVASGASEVSATSSGAQLSGMLTLLSLRKELIEDRLALHRHQGGQMESGATGHNQQNSVLELVLDRMAIKDCGECDGATQSPLVDYTQLRRLTLNFNHLTKVHTARVIQPLTELRELEIDFNKLSAFGPLKNQRLEQMTLSHNVLLSITGLALPRLHTLDLSHNALGREFVTAALDAKDPSLRLPSLTMLDVSHNKLTTFEWVGSLTKLTTLRAAHNMIASKKKSPQPYDA
ncbi:Hypothetical protein, putative [Bodo saltans]|uniref:Leucine-rich repeat protein n=1 Tax=Bodo saltans TaxID=75058 RepID=A0A0S4IVS3_BODSA|nr:Hypothetical protein, putative [Bodo saltans]|eukprot:CUF19806.1 Hypothetical protein, putative [Bodo saltans]